jgi:hypothetical protein
VVKPEGDGSLEGPRHRWEDNIKLDLKEMVWKSVHWIYVA